jgi:hypothetical protein
MGQCASVGSFASDGGRNTGKTAGRERFLRSNVTSLKELAGATGLEAAASCVTGIRSNQLNYFLAWNNSFTLIIVLSDAVWLLNAGG